MYLFLWICVCPCLCVRAYACHGTRVKVRGQPLVLVFCITLFEAGSLLFFATVWFSRLVGSQASEGFSCLCLSSHHSSAGITDMQQGSQAYKWAEFKLRSSGMLSKYCISEHIPLKLFKGVAVLSLIIIYKR